MAIITISRGSASGGRLVAEGLAERLGYAIVSREDIVQEAARFGVPEEKLRGAILKPLKFWDRFKDDRRRYLAFVQAALTLHALEDNLVYHGNAGQFLLSGPSNVIRVRLIAPIDFRVDLLVRRDGMTTGEARDYIDVVDRQREMWARFLYGVDIMDPHMYDLTINLDTLDVAGSIEVIAAAASSPRYATTDESRRAMSDLVLSSRVRAALAADHDTASVDVEVMADDGVVTLKGRVAHVSQVEAAIQVSEGVDGVARVVRDFIGAPDFTI